MRIGGGCGRAEAGPRPEPGAPALDLVSCSPGRQLEGRREREGGEVAGEDSAETSGGNFNRDTESEREREKREKGETVVVEVWKEDSGKAIRFL